MKMPCLKDKINLWLKIKVEKIKMFRKIALSRLSHIALIIRCCIWSEGQQEAKTTKEEVEDASGEGEQARVLVRRRNWIELRLLVEWGKSDHPYLQG